jgi:hypothetical protein
VPYETHNALMRSIMPGSASLPWEPESIATKFVWTSLLSLRSFDALGGVVELFQRWTVCATATTCTPREVPRTVCGQGWRKIHVGSQRHCCGRRV